MRSGTGPLVRLTARLRLAGLRSTGKAEASCAGGVRDDAADLGRVDVTPARPSPLSSSDMTTSPPNEWPISTGGLRQGLDDPVRGGRRSARNRPPPASRDAPEPRRRCRAPPATRAGSARSPPRGTVPARGSPAGGVQPQTVDEHDGHAVTGHRYSSSIGCDATLLRAASPRERSVRMPLPGGIVISALPHCRSTSDDQEEEADQPSLCGASRPGGVVGWMPGSQRSPPRGSGPPSGPCNPAVQIGEDE